MRDMARAVLLDRIGMTPAKIDWPQWTATDCLSLPEAVLGGCHDWFSWLKGQLRAPDPATAMFSPIKVERNRCAAQRSLLLTSNRSRYASQRCRGFASSETVLAKQQEDPLSTFCLSQGSSKS